MSRGSGFIAGCLLLVLVFVQLAVGQSSGSAVVEDFDDDTVGMNPSEAWYDFAKQPSGETVEVAAAIAGGSDRALQWTATGGSGDTEFQFELNTPYAYTNVSFDHAMTVTSADPLDYHATYFNLRQDGSLGDWDDNFDPGRLGSYMLQFDASSGDVTTGSYRNSIPGSLTTDVSASCADPGSTVVIHVEISLDYELNQTTIATSSTNGACSEITKTMPDTSASVIRFFDMAERGNNEGFLQLDNLVISGDEGAPGQPVAPLQVPGVSAVVTSALNLGNEESENGVVEVRWFLSPNDPNQDNGTLLYEIHRSGVVSGVTNDDTTSLDGDGVRFHKFEYTTNSQDPATWAFQIRAVNLTTGLQSPLSCSVSVDLAVLGDRDSCGSGGLSGGLGGSSGLEHTTPTDTASGLRGFIADLMGDSAASLFLGGLILVLIVFLGIGAAFAGLAGAAGMPAVVAGSVGAFGMMIFLVVAQIWSLGAAAVIILLATGVALALMRRLFFGGGGGGS